ncbi:hypothetical protein NWQ33_05300 [Mycoplasmopsis cynos]|nr:hypothetical protein [Mycoplasmopsis cynos]
MKQLHQYKNHVPIDFVLNFNFSSNDFSAFNWEPIPEKNSNNFIVFIILL